MLKAALRCGDERERSWLRIFRAGKNLGFELWVVVQIRVVFPSGKILKGFSKPSFCGLGKGQNRVDADGPTYSLHTALGCEGNKWKIEMSLFSTNSTRRLICFKEPLKYPFSERLKNYGRTWVSAPTSSHHRSVHRWLEFSCLEALSRLKLWSFSRSLLQCRIAWASSWNLDCK